MDPILVKIFAAAFTLSEVLTHPASVRTHLDPATDQDQVVQVLRAGCNHMRRAFDIETINLDDLISTALDDSADAIVVGSRRQIQLAAFAAREFGGHALAGFLQGLVFLDEGGQKCRAFFRRRG